YRVPEENELSEILKNVDYRKILLSEDNMISLTEGMMADLGSVAKGYTGDKVLELFKKTGISNALINLGGNVQTLGGKPDGSSWKVAIADPDGSSSYAGYVAVNGKTVITSGAYERFFEENGKIYHHIIDTSTGYPANNGLISVSVIGNEGVVCDALSTSLFAMGPEKAIAFWKNSDDFEAVFITADEKIFVTEGIEKDFVPLGRFQNAVSEVIRRD
nr:FAD:protein FMN transferase [Lachnospiraceae bacterium]